MQQLSTAEQLTQRQHALEGQDVVLWAEAMHALEEAQAASTEPDHNILGDVLTLVAVIILSIGIIVYLTQR